MASEQATSGGQPEQVHATLIAGDGDEASLQVDVMAGSAPSLVGNQVTLPAAGPAD